MTFLVQKGIIKKKGVTWFCHTLNAFANSIT